MTPIATVRERLTWATDLPHVLDAACAAFEVMLSVIEEHENPANGIVPGFMRAANRAADGRDAVLFAPSLPPRPLRSGQSGGGADRVEGADWAGDVASLGEVLSAVLVRAASAAADDGDRRACGDAAQCAADIRRLVAGAGP
jgi:hypothetical protein